MINRLDIQEAWDKAKAHLQDKLGKAAFETWILPLSPKQKDEFVLGLEAPDNFFRDWVEKHYGQAIQEALDSSSKQRLKVNLETNSQIKAGYPSSGAQALPAKPKEFKETSGLNPRYTFE